MPTTHTADFQTAALKATDLEAVEKINVGLETELARKQLNIIADAPEIRIQDKTGSASETTMSIVADGGATHFRAGIDTFAEGTETKGNVKFQSSTGATTHAEIVGSSGTLELQDGGLALKLGSNVSVTGTSKVIQEITGPHARESAVLKKYPEVPLTSNVQRGYVASASSEFSSNYQIWKAHDGETVLGTAPSYYYSAATQAYSTTDGSYTGGTYSTTSSGTAYAGEYVQMQFPTPIKLSYVRIVSPDAGATYNKNSPKQGVICGSNDGTTWTTIAAYSGITYATLGASATIQAPSNVAYKYIRLVATHIEGVGSSGWFVIEELEYYGYEDVGAGDDSVDTTVKSVYNAPDLTSAALYIDGKKSGSTPTDYGPSNITVTDNGTWDSSDNTWSLSGATTSNLVSADLGFVGDQPHSVSAWVKADRLNGSGLFHVGTAEGEGDAASRVGFVDDSHISWGGADHFFSNTEWHNVTYTYNGEGSDKKLYLDGRLVGTAKNEDSTAEYPPFAMSTYSQYGYTVSVSSTYSSSDRQGWNAFDDNPSTANPYRWVSGDHYVNGVYTRSPPERHVDVDGNAEDGEWLKIQMPHKLKVSYFGIKANPTSGSQSWRDYAILGSNDNVNWYQIQKVSGLGVGNGLTGGSNEVTVVPTGTYKNSAFKYFVFIWHNKANDVNGHVSMGEMRIFGHRENDLVRFPDSVNVLKYPHITVDEPAKRGYAVSQSSQLLPSTGGSTGYYHGYNVFDREVNIVNRKAWISMNGGNSTPLLYDTNGDPTAAAADTVVDGTTTSGEWVQLKLPHKIKLSYLRLMPPSEGGTTLNRAPKDGVLAGSTDGTTWTAVSSWSGASYSDLQYNTFTANIDSTNSYDYLRLIVKKTGGATLTSIQELEFYGTESGDVVARVGDGFDGKVRNLRVYSTALSDARAQEIFDADKDEFGLAKSSVSVYRGHLGVGTTEPKAALTVMDEVAELGEFPPKPIMAPETYMEGHGNFKVYGSHYNVNPILYQPYAGFKRPMDPSTNWSLNTYNTDNASYDSTTKQVASGASLGGYAGEWLKLSLPYGVKLSGYQMMIRGDWSNYGPGDWVIVGSNDDTTWHLIVSVTGGGITAGETGVPKTKDFVVETTKYYKHLAFVCSAIHGAGVNQLNFTGLCYFGTREKGASTLHNGELSLTRNLTVPRIGPPLDADDTPRRDRLVVEYNTSTNPTENGVVKDTSGRGLDGLLDNTYGGAAYNPYYDASEKALVFDGSNDYVFQNDVHLKTGVGGMYSASVWVRNRASSGTHTVYSLGTYAQLTTSTLYVLDTTLQVVFYNSDLNVTYTIPKNTWTHIVVTHAGGATSTTTKMYINGVDVGLAAASGTSYPLSTVNFPSPCNLFLGKNSDNSVYGGPMDLSNFKLYDVALTADEVKRLYDMGRLGNVIAQPVHIAAPLYAPGTIVQVESSTKYDTFSATGLNTHPLSPGNDVPGLSVTIHPKFANSKILISYDVNMGSYGRAYLRIQRTQGGNVTAIEAPIGPAGSTTEGKSTSSAVFGSATNSEVCAASFTHYDDANSTVPITYQIQAWTYHSTYYVHINRAHQDHDGTTNNSTYWARTLSSITAKEVCQ